MRIVPLDRFLLKMLVENERDPLTAEMASGSQFADRALVGPAFAMIDGPFAVAGAGLILMHAGRAELWALITTHARPRHIVKGTRAMRDFLDKRQRDPCFRRIEMFVRAHQCWSASFATSMGFVQEGFLKAWDPSARDYLLFARVRL